MGWLGGLYALLEIALIDNIHRYYDNYFRGKSQNMVYQRDIIRPVKDLIMLAEDA